MPLSDPESAAQVKVFAEQVANKVLAEYQPQIAQLERSVARLNSAVPDEGGKVANPVLKWVAGVAAVVLGFVITGSLAWTASTMTEMKETLARMDERQKAQSEAQDTRFADYDRRITRLERYHQEGSGT